MVCTWTELRGDDRQGSHLGRTPPPIPSQPSRPGTSQAVPEGIGSTSRARLLGGHDRSAAVAWLREQYGIEVVTLTVDLAGGSLREGGRSAEEATAPFHGRRTRGILPALLQPSLCCPGGRVDRPRWWRGYRRCPQLPSDAKSRGPMINRIDDQRIASYPQHQDSSRRGRRYGRNFTESAHAFYLILAENFSELGTRWPSPSRPDRPYAR